MSKNIDQVYTANPITSNASTDLMYFGQSPYTAGDDAAMTYANFSAQFGAPYTPAALTSANDTNVTLTLGGTPTTALLHAASITAGWTGQLSLTRGGTNASLTASNGGIFYSTASAGSILAGTATANQVLLSGSSTTPAWSTATYPATTTINQILYSSSANVIGGISTANSATMYTTTAGVPTFTGSMTNGQLLVGSTSANPVLATLTAGTGITITNGAGSITVAVNGAEPWVDETGSSVTMTTNTGYIADDGPTLVTLTLPTTSAIGDWIEVVGKGTGLWKIAQAAGQQIFSAALNTTSGTGGSLASVNAHDCVRLRCITANTLWNVVSQQSTGLTIV
jgi:hypothetical protein